jgi:hypothetical protein
MSRVGQLYELQHEGPDGFTDYKFRVTEQRGAWLDVVLYEIHRRPDEGEDTIETTEVPYRARIIKTYHTDVGTYEMIRIMMGNRNAKWCAFRVMP